MRDRQTMARRVRGYVTQAKASNGGSVAPGRATSTERKALATMGRRGGQKAAQRWKTDPDGECAQGRRDMLKKRTSSVNGRGMRPVHGFTPYTLRCLLRQVKPQQGLRLEENWGSLGRQRVSI